MARRQRRTHSATFNAEVAVAALRGDKTIAEIAKNFEVHPNQVTAWKAQLLERSSEAFGEQADGTPAPNIERYNSIHPHASLGGKTPDKIHSLAPAEELLKAS
jgi:transposase-like protein